jgi:hypothetical protein
MASDPRFFDADELLALARHDVQRGDLQAGLLKLKGLVALASPPAEAIATIARVYAQLGLRTQRRADG